MNADELAQSIRSKHDKLETGKAAKVLKVADPAFLKGGTQ